MRVSVLMPVYNGEQYLKEALESVLQQTFEDFELVIINDGSTDRSVDIIKSYHDSRIKLLSKENSGIVDSLNLGIKNSSGKYIARMDADDISKPDRLAHQVKFLDLHPDIGLLGTTAQVISEDGSFSHINPVLTEDEDIRKALLVSNMFAHGSTMFRRDVLANSGHYRKEAFHVEDYDLWVRIASQSKMANLTDALYLWRNNSKGVSSANLELQLRSEEEVRSRYFGETESRGDLPKPSLVRAGARKRFYLARADEFKAERLRILASVSAKYSQILWRQGRRLEALTELASAVLFTPSSPRIYLSIVAVIFGEEVANFVETQVRRLRNVLRDPSKLRKLISSGEK